jgi:integrase
MALVQLKFSDATLRALKAPERGQTDYADSLTPGLSVRVGKRTKTFMFRRVIGGRRERITIGQYADVTLARAREKSRQLRAEKTLGLAVAKPSSSFPECLEEFLAIKRQANRPNTIRFTERLLRKHFPFTVDVSSIDGKAIAEKLEAITAPSERSHAFAEARTFFNWLARQRRIPFSPLVALDTPEKPEGRDRVLTDEELISVWRSAPQSVYGDIIRIALLTGQRTGQLTALRGEFIANGLLTWPGSHMKAGRRHVLPLTDTVASMLAAYPKKGLLFPSQKGGPFRIRDREKKVLDKTSGVSNWTHHDLRRTLATKMAEIGIAPHVIERILAHQTGTISGVSAIYNRHHFLPEMKLALLAFEEKLQTLLQNAEGDYARYRFG